MEKYRVVERKDIIYNNEIEYIIEKRRKFLWWEWWSTDYLMDGIFQSTYYEFRNKIEAEYFCSKLNGEQGPIYEKNVIE